jgi:hypothetical protein
MPENRDVWERLWLFYCHQNEQWRGFDGQNVGNCHPGHRLLRCDPEDRRNEPGLFAG